MAARQALGVTAPMLAPVAGACHPQERERSAQAAAAQDGVAGFALTGQSLESTLSVLHECSKLVWFMI